MMSGTTSSPASSAAGVEVVASDAASRMPVHRYGTMVNSGQFDAWRPRRPRGDRHLAGGARLGEAAGDLSGCTTADSRQRYWGPPIHDHLLSNSRHRPGTGGSTAVLLPEIEDFRRPAPAKSPLASVPSFVNTTCPICGGPAERETDVLIISWTRQVLLRYTSTEWDDRPSIGSGRAVAARRYVLRRQRARRDAPPVRAVHHDGAL